MNDTLNDIDIELIRQFIEDKEDVPKIMVGNTIFYSYTNNNIDIATYKNYLIAKDRFEYKYKDEPYLHFRIFTVECFQLAKSMQKQVDDFFIFRFEENIKDKYCVMEQEIFVLYSNPNIVDILKNLSVFEFVDGLEEDKKMKFIFDEYEKYMKYKATC